VTGPMTVLRSDRLKVGDRVICEKFHDGTRGRERFVIIARPVPQSAAVTEEKKLTEYEQYLKLHTQGSRVAQRGNALMINDTTSIKVRGQEVQYDRLDRGSDYCMFVVRYMNESKVGVKGLHNPIVSIKPITRLEGTPKGVVAGDVEIGDYTVHVLSASDEECRYVPIRTIR
ncbi:MAG TPA: hypothetical protein VLG69_04130, partial [Candidatus Andersenbacteria bacterium]|nr:hypothetical protein [Candidatus Andersenbacteria bacterium]